MAVTNEFCSITGTSYAKWGTWDALVWKLWPQWARGGAPTLTAYKDAWSVYNKTRITESATQYSIPPLLLACVAWAEVGGKPDWTKRPAFEVRSFDWSGPNWMDKYMTITKPPGETSFGAVSIQLRAVARELGFNLDQLSYDQQSRMIDCLETDAFNLDIVAKHLRGLILYDYPDAKTTDLTDEQFVVAGSRYNRGTQRSLADFQASYKAAPGTPIREYSSYGRAMLTHRTEIKRILGF